MTTMVKQTFMNRLHRELSHKIGDQPRLDLANTVELAVRIWDNSHNRSNQNLTLFPQQVEEQRSSGPPRNGAPTAILTRSTPQRNNELQGQDWVPTRTVPRPQRPRRDEAKFEETLDEVIERMKKLEAHLTQIERTEVPPRRIDYRDARRSLPTQRQEFNRSERRPIACYK